MVTGHNDNGTSLLAKEVAVKNKKTVLNRRSNSFEEFTEMLLAGRRRCGFSTDHRRRVYMFDKEISIWGNLSSRLS